MEKRYQYSIDLFRVINPAKKYSQFTYTPVDSFDDFHLYMNKNEIVEMKGVYYQYAGSKDYESIEPRKSYIMVKQNNTVITTIDL